MSVCEFVCALLIVMQLLHHLVSISFSFKEETPKVPPTSRRQIPNSAVQNTFKVLKWESA